MYLEEAAVKHAYLVPHSIDVSHGAFSHSFRVMRLLHTFMNHHNQAQSSPHKRSSKRFSLIRRPGRQEQPAVCYDGFLKYRHSFLWRIKERSNPSHFFCNVSPQLSIAWPVIYDCNVTIQHELSLAGLSSSSTDASGHNYHALILSASRVIHKVNSDLCQG